MTDDDYDIRGTSLAQEDAAPVAPAEKSSFARFVVRPGCDGSLIGLDRGIFEEGQVYEAREVLGEIVIVKLGPGALSMPPREAQLEFGFNNAHSTEAIMCSGGAFVRTLDELRKR